MIRSKEQNKIVRSSAELGRYLVATRDLAPGELILTERPIVFGPKTSANPEAIMPCVGCYKPVSTEVGERCPKCGWPVCSGNCSGLTDPRHHGIECKILSSRPECALNNMEDYYRHDALLPLRCLLLQSDTEKWERLLQMQSHTECRLPGSEVYDEVQEFIVDYLTINFITKLDKDIKNKYLSNCSTDLIHRMCGVIDTNCLEIRLREGCELLALYEKTSIMEHSCVPNTKHIFNYSTKDKDDLYRITLKTVLPVEKNHHITTTYSHVLWGTQARRQHLKETKYFGCKCIRCSDPTELGTYFSAMRCLGDGNNFCDGIHLPNNPLEDETEWSCNKCCIKVENSQVSIIISQMGEEVDHVQMMGGSITMLENLLCKLSTFLHPNHYHMYSIKHSLIQLYGRQPNYMSQDILEKKIKMCKELIRITNTLDPGYVRLNLYRSVLQHELHSALLLKSKQIISKDKKKINEVKHLLIEAKCALEEALTCLEDETSERAGEKLYIVIENSRKEFRKYCKEKKIKHE